MYIMMRAAPQLPHARTVGCRARDNLSGKRLHRHFTSVRRGVGGGGRGGGKVAFSNTYAYFSGRI